MMMFRLKFLSPKEREVRRVKKLTRFIRLEVEQLAPVQEELTLLKLV
jgi:hypothetical protein